MHASCGSLDGAAGRGRSMAVADALISRWSRRSGASLAWPSHLPGGSGGEPASSFTAEAVVGVLPSATDAGRHAVDGRTTSLQPVFNASAAPPSIEELFAEVDEDDTDTSAAVTDFLAEEKVPGELKDGRRHGAALLSRTDSYTFVASASPEVTRFDDTGKAARSPCTPASATVEAALLEALLQEQLSQDLNGSVDDTAEEDSDGLDEVAPRAADAHAIINASCALPQGQYRAPDLQRAAHMETAGGDADGEADVKADSIEDAVDDEESMESVLEEEAERMYRAALTNMTNGEDTAAQGKARHGLFGDYTFFSKEAVASAVETLSTSESADAAGATSAFAFSDGIADGASTSAVEFDDDAAREAEMESVGDVMATSGAAAVAAGKAQKG
ncbi:hypothetical protein, unknown function [Leishmania infantum JPCM5]|uniref:Uncharacterized protein n=4 Tax=Leishmania donovani species complex TaxID=38574 RepID=A4I991_LEIIN|nr:hypothetical protein, unknown function [Leishmania infantum JPCM5]XP_003864057.1 hypothetical protein, unknown function [Leishmania donovani]CAC9533291.1 hypothetical_protein_-_conserved [Leishmania infantum]AYU82213.1 hypothetical protein LdCL_330030200 [Leishmania donovani]CAM71394.1 hypothetical protein, unknown function [Leishmania infantum JPCM5]CBZ37375.1 hypothetical protein, unknown function [Leishmania donovani]SUZ45242.1 hypothetical_protein_-_conserved [Leishmania infantum]|eukprot:XP_001468310.1 hypothetical protein, unknown function [Leishmania infantum JPCM5]